MPDNEFKNEILQVIPETRAEIAMAEEAAAELVSGLDFLRDIDPNGTFDYEPVTNESCDKKIKTTLRTTETFAGPLTLRINALGEIFSKMSGLAEMECYAREFNNAAEKTQNEALKETVTDTPTALREIARQAVLQGQISVRPEDSRVGATPAQQAVLDGLRLGFDDSLVAEGERVCAWAAAENIDAGLSALARTSDAFVFEAQTEGNTVVFLTQAAGATSTIIVTPGGCLKIGTEEYDAFDKAAVGKILTDIAKQAVLDGQVSAISDELNNSTDPLEIAVRDGLHTGLEEGRLAKEKKIFTEMAAWAEAQDVIDVLEELEGKSNGAFEFKREYFEGGTVRLTLNPGSSTQQYIMIEASGEGYIGTKASGKKFDTHGDRKALTATLQEAARQTVFQGKIPRETKNPRPQPSF